MEREPQEQAIEVAMPIGLRYDLSIADAVPANRNLSQFLASNASDFTPSNNVVRINVSSGAFLDLRNAVLQYDLKNTTTTDPVQLDGGADCIINRIRILSSDGSEIERIEQYGQLASIIDQYTGGDGNMRTQGALKGVPCRFDDSPLLDSTTLATTGTAAQALPNGLSFKASATLGGDLTIVNNTGGIGYDQKQADILNTGVSRKYTFGLKCGFFNPLTAKLLPPNSPFQLEITFDQGQNCLNNRVNASTNIPNYQVNNVELHIPAIVINDPSFMARMNARMGSGMSWKSNSYLHSVNTSASGSGKDVIQIPTRARSLKGLLTVLRKQANVVDGLDMYKLSRRSIQYVEDYQYKIGSNNYPVDRVSLKTDTTGGGTGPGVRIHIPGTADLNVSEAYTQALRLFGNLSVNNADTLIGVESFAQSENNNGTGVLAMDLSAFSDGSTNSGMNTLNNMPISIEFTKTAACNAILQVDTFGVVELSILRLPSGVLASVY
jgi:hypothetical protein